MFKLASSYDREFDDSELSTVLLHDCDDTGFTAAAYYRFQPSVGGYVKLDLYGEYKDYVLATLSCTSEYRLLMCSNVADPNSLFPWYHICITVRDVMIIMESDSDWGLGTQRAAFDDLVFDSLSSLPFIIADLCERYVHIRSESGGIKAVLWCVPEAVCSLRPLALVFVKKQLLKLLRLDF